MVQLATKVQLSPHFFVVHATNHGAVYMESAERFNLPLEYNVERQFENTDNSQ